MLILLITFVFCQIRTLDKTDNPLAFSIPTYLAEHSLKLVWLMAHTLEPHYKTNVVAQNEVLGFDS